MSNRPVPALDGGGWITGINQKVGKLFAYFLSSDQSQSNHYTEIHSLQDIIKKASNDELRLQESIKNALISLFEEYFDFVDIDVRVVPIGDDDTEPKLNIRISGEIKEGNVSTTILKAIQTENNTISNFVDLTG